MNPTVLKVFGTGQITIPKRWRDAHNTNLYMAKDNGTNIILEPIKNEESVIFDADEHNDGEGVEINDFIKALENSLK